MNDAPMARATVAATPAFSPLYRQIKALLVRSLQAGEWLPAQAIPSETELALRFGVSQGTVRKAVDELAADNLLVRRQGKGTFVATHAEQATRYRFLRLTADAGAADVPLQRRLLDCRRLRAPAEVARHLQLQGGDTALQVRRLLVLPPVVAGGSHTAPDAGGGRPLVLDDLWLPGQLFKGLSAERLEAWRGPLYGLFESEFAVHMTRADEQIRAVPASADAAVFLDLPVGTPLLSVERLSYTYGDRPVEWRRGLYLTTAHHYRNALS
ncbi:MAG: GntR family transcriptional regulator [Rubrivivax sp.]